MWLHVPSCVASACSAEPEGSTWESESLCRALAQSAMWRGKFLPWRSWRRAWRRDGSMMRLSGLTCEPSTLARGVDGWIWSWLASPARTSPTPAVVLESRASARAFGSRSRESLARFDPGTCSWKTSEPSLFGGSTPFSDRWPSSGSMRSGVCFRHRRRARPTSGSGSSSWPSPVAGGFQDGEDPKTWLARRERLKQTAKNGNGCGTPLTMAVVLWQTSNLPNGGGKTRVGSRSGELLLEGQAANWSTPRSSENENRQTRPSPSQTNLRTADLSHQAETPASGENCSPPPRGSRPQLNPAFVWWLMGLPWWWGNIDITSCERRATEWFRLRRRGLSSSFGIGCTPIDTPGRQAGRTAEPGALPGPL